MEPSSDGSKAAASPSGQHAAASTGGPGPLVPCDDGALAVAEHVVRQQTFEGMLPAVKEYGGPAGFLRAKMPDDESMRHILLHNVSF